MECIVKRTPALRYGRDGHHVLGVLYSDSDSEYKGIGKIVWSLFSDILFQISQSSSEMELRTNMNTLKFLKENFNDYYKFGFGSNHMWVKQIDDKGECTFGDNIILVNF